MKFLVFTTDIPPLKGVPTSGTALRTFGLMKGLEAHGHEVIPAVPHLALQGLLRSTDEQSLPIESQKQVELFKRTAFGPENAPSLIQEHQPDAIICGHWPAYCFRTKPSQPVILDLAGPHLLERHYQGMSSTPLLFEEGVNAKLGNVGAADLFIVSGDSQRYYFLSFLARAANDGAASRTVSIPMPLNPRLPTPQKTAGDPRFIFGGVFLPWQDPSLALRTLASELTHRERGLLTFIGGKHPNYDVSEGAYTTLLAELSNNPRIVTKPMLPYEGFIDELLQADAAIDLMRWNLERQLAMTIRSTTYLWAGVPVIYNDFADLSKWIRQYDAGWCISGEKALRDVIEEIYNDPELVRVKSRNAQRLAAEVFSWDRAVEPLLNLIASTSPLLRFEADIAIDLSQSATLPVTQETPMEQRFLSRRPGLCKVECRLTSLGENPSDALTMTLVHLGRDREVIAKRTISTSDLKDNGWVALNFAPLRDSAGAHFSLELHSSAPRSLAAFSPWTMHAQIYPLESVRHGERSVPQTVLCLRTTCAESISFGTPKKYPSTNLTTSNSPLSPPPQTALL